MPSLNSSPNFLTLVRVWVRSARSATTVRRGLTIMIVIIMIKNCMCVNLSGLCVPRVYLIVLRIESTFFASLLYRFNYIWQDDGWRELKRFVDACLYGHWAMREFCDRIVFDHRSDQWQQRQQQQTSAMNANRRRRRRERERKDNRKWKHRVWFSIWIKQYRLFAASHTYSKPNNNWVELCTIVCDAHTHRDHTDVFALNVHSRDQKTNLSNCTIRWSNTMKSAAKNDSSRRHFTHEKS